MINEAFINYLKHHPRGLILKDIKCLGTLKLILLFLKKKSQIELIYRGQILTPSIKDADEIIIMKAKVSAYYLHFSKEGNFWRAIEEIKR